jgi:hypothetical protein
MVASMPALSPLLRNSMNHTIESTEHQWREIVR